MNNALKYHSHYICYETIITIITGASCLHRIREFSLHTEMPPVVDEAPQIMIHV